MAVTNLVKRIQKKMWKDAGINGDAQRIEQMVWMFFLKVYDAQEYEWEIDAMDKKEEYKSIIPEDLRWRNWAPSKDENGKIKKDFLTGEKLLNFVNNTLFPVLQGKDSLDKQYTGIRINKTSKRHEAIVKEVFDEVNQYMKNGQLLRDVIDIIDDVDLMDNEESHAFGDIYESILRDMQSAGNAGEFYTPRPVTDFTVEKINPRLGELMGDLASGTCGFVVSALNHLAKQKKTTDDEILFQNSVMGQEWKPFPYLLGVTNIMLHGIKEPMVYHMDSLSHPMSDYQEDGKLDTIAMNPPFGGATDVTTAKNFKQEYRSSETADLFMVLIMQRLAKNGRAGVVLPDSFLFGTDGAKFAIKQRLLTEFNLHTIVRLPTSVFSPYTPIATNILFFDNKPDEDAPEGYATKETWFYRLDMPTGYKHFSKMKRILPEHFDPVREWWNNRQILDAGEKSRAFSPQELIETLKCNFDQCKFPEEEEDILTPKEIMTSYLDRSEECYRQIRNSFSNLLNNLQGSKERNEFLKLIANPWKELADISTTLPERLKKSILQEAIMGKLGTQDEKDEPASVLMEQIRKEKKRLVEEGVLKKKNLEETPVDEEEKLFNIPESWEWCKIGSLFLHSNGKQLKGGDNEGTLHQYITTSNLYWDRFVLDNLKSMYFKDSELEKCTATRGDLLVCEGGDVGRCAIWPYDYDICLQNHVHRLRSIKEINTRYIMYTFMLYKAKGEIGGKGIGIKGLSASVLKNITIPLPPLAEQHRIVQRIEDLFAEIDNMTITNNNNKTVETENE